MYSLVIIVEQQFTARKIPNSLKTIDTTDAPDVVLSPGLKKPYKKLDNKLNSISPVNIKTGRLLSDRRYNYLYN